MTCSEEDVLLTDEERMKFAAYCEQWASDNDILINNLESLSFSGSPPMIELKRRMELESTAFRVVARIIIATESQTVANEASR